MYSAPRVLQVGLFVSEWFRVAQGILAGCAYATVLLRLYLTCTLDSVIPLAVNISAYLVVDD
eukprot:6791262-Pyramimonas_sp.AAC.1